MNGGSKSIKCANKKLKPFTFIDTAKGTDAAWSIKEAEKSDRLQKMTSLLITEGSTTSGSVSTITAARPSVATDRRNREVEISLPKALAKRDELRKLLNSQIVSNCIDFSHSLQ